jgi:propanol-preferring alcohol dehydrogenase
MRALEFTRTGVPLRLVQRNKPQPGPGCVLLRVTACGVCRTDLHIVDGELPTLDHAIVPGHEIVGTVAATGTGVDDISVGQRIGVPWLAWTCGRCAYCTSGRENLCDAACFTGYHIDGGYADYAVAGAAVLLAER